MKTYAKINEQNKLDFAPAALNIAGINYTPPSAKQYLAAGYKELDSETQPHCEWNEKYVEHLTEDETKIYRTYTVELREVTDEEIDHLRQEEYVRQSDPHLSAYLYYKEKGETEKTAEAFQRVEEIKAQIQARYPKTTNNS